MKTQTAFQTHFASVSDSTWEAINKRQQTVVVAAPTKGKLKPGDWIFISGHERVGDELARDSTGKGLIKCEIKEVVTGEGLKAGFCAIVVDVLRYSR